MYPNMRIVEVHLDGADIVADCDARSARERRYFPFMRRVLFDFAAGMGLAAMAS